jgi:alkanesulfonate monooxygenase SsuD/methylene tetrahydromethanopterin reductase-like flavin-dependent oxidoreductase (luciferase family)
MNVYLLRFDMRAPDTGAPPAELYRAAIEMAEWADERGCITVMVSEHHSSPDGYLPSPLVLAGAIAARTTKVPITVGALLLNFYDPIKLAEDMIVLDIVSQGRVSYTVGLGYRPEEHAMFGIDMATRGATMDRKLDALMRALAGERFTYEGRDVHVTPRPFSENGPRLAYGGHSLAAARRAGRFGLDLFAEGGTDDLVAAYEAAARAAGHTPGFAYVPSKGSPTSVFLAEDVDEAWAQLGPHLLHDATMYGEWMGDNAAPASRSDARTVEALRSENGPYQILTVAEAAAMVRQGRPLSMQPLCGGLPPELAWASVRLAGTALQEALA